MLSEGQRQIRDMAHQFAQRELAPTVAERDRAPRFPREAFAKMGELGMLGMTVPAEFGGAGTDYVSYALAIMEIAAADGATSTSFQVHNSLVCLPILRHGTPEQKERYLRPLARGEQLGAFCLTEPGAGSDAAAIATRAEKAGNKFILNGTKQFITSGKSADLALVFAVTDPAAGKSGISAFIVPTSTPGYTVVRIEHTMGQRSSDHCQIAFAARLRDAGQPCLKEASMAKLFASEMAEQVCSSAIQIHGGYGYLNDFPVERIYRDARVCTIYEGTSDIQRLVIGRQLASELRFQGVT